jgi:hypothetical protein
LMVISNKLACTVGTVGTLALVDPVTELRVAFSDVLPNPVLVARPLELIEMIAGLPELQLAEEVRSCVLLSANVPVAVNCRVSLS